MKRLLRMPALAAGSALLIVLLAPGCLDENALEPSPLPIERLTPVGGAQHSGLTDELRLAVHDPISFAGLWKKAWPEAPVPDVDFATHTVLVVAMGEQSSGGYAIQVAAAAAGAGGLDVEVLSVSPGPGCAVPTVMTQPVDIVSVAAHGLTARFDEEHVVTPCK